MWLAKLRIDGKNAAIGGLCHKHNISAFGYPLSFRTINKKISCHFVMSLLGEEKAKSAFFSDLKKHTRMMQIERVDDLLIGELSETFLTKQIYNYRLVHVEPVQFLSDGLEIWTVSSTKKEDILAFIKSTEKMHNLDILSIKSSKQSAIAITTAYPKLTKMQKEAARIAVDNGYYSVPRKVELTELAKIMGISYSTYQVHLRKAERKLIPHFLSMSK